MIVESRARIPRCVIETAFGKVEVEECDERFPLGSRGQRPFHFYVSDIDHLLDLKSSKIPGLVIKGNRVDCAFDLVEVIVCFLSYTSSGATGTYTSFEQIEPALYTEVQRRLNLKVPLPGLEEYKQLGLDKIRREYQAEASKFLLRRSYGILGYYPRAGKTLMFISTCILAGCKQILIVCGSLGKPVWAEEFAKWMNAPAVLLYGRGANDYRIFCLPCNGRGCTECGGRGELRREVKTLELVTNSYETTVETGKFKKDGSPKLQKKKVKFTPLPRQYRCPLHPEVTAGLPIRCKMCESDMKSALDTARVVVVNYDILNAQTDKDLQGSSFTRDDLSGWSGMLSQINFDVAGLDEVHRIRDDGLRSNTGSKSKKQTRRDRVEDICSNIDRVYGITGTLIVGQTADIWSPVSIITKGLLEKKPWTFYRRYCGAKMNEMGFYEYKGKTRWAETELVKRLNTLVIKRSRAEVWKDTPPKTRQTIRIDAGLGASDGDKSVKKLMQHASETHYFKALERTLDHKLEALTENVFEELSVGEKTIVWVLTRESVEIVTSHFEKVGSSRQYKNLLAQKNTRMWATHGEADVKSRNDIARDFRDHDGAGVIIVTMDSMPESISLFGATTEHYAQLHYNPGPMVQSENRPYLKETSRLHILYYIVKDSIDERIEALVLPKIEAMEKVLAEQDAQDAIVAFKAGKKEESFDEFMSRLTKNAVEDADIDWSGSGFVEMSDEEEESNVGA